LTTLYVDKFGFQPITGFLEPPPVGRLDYLDTNGAVAESVEYADEQAFIDKIREEDYYGAAFSITVYKDGDKSRVNTEQFIEDINPTRSLQYTEAPESHIRAAEMSTEQNINMIDAVPNNTEYDHTPTMAEIEADVAAGKAVSFMDIVAAQKAEGKTKASDAFPAVYPNSADIARDRGELPVYRESNKLNEQCAAAIGKAINDSNYKPFHYDLKTAMEKVTAEYGEKRVSWVMAAMVQRHDYDGRYTPSNKRWAQGFDIPREQEYGGKPLIPYYGNKAHATLIDGFITRLREHMERKPSLTGQLKEDAKRLAATKTDKNHDITKKPKQEALE